MNVFPCNNHFWMILMVALIFNNMSYYSFFLTIIPIIGQFTWNFKNASFPISLLSCRTLIFKNFANRYMKWYFIFLFFYCSRIVFLCKLNTFLKTLFTYT